MGRQRCKETQPPAVPATFYDILIILRYLLRIFVFFFDCMPDFLVAGHVGFELVEPDDGSWNSQTVDELTKAMEGKEIPHVITFGKKSVRARRDRVRHTITHMHGDLGWTYGMKLHKFVDRSWVKDNKSTFNYTHPYPNPNSSKQTWTAIAMVVIQQNIYLVYR